MAAGDLVVGGLTPFTTLDVPGRLAAVVFCQGCPWRCTYCHNRHLLARRTALPIPWPDIRAFLEGRRGFLDAVAFSGGEPLAQAAVHDAVVEVKSLGFLAALHTGGAHPKRFARLLPHLDWVGFDAKAPFDAYAAVTGVPRSGGPARESLKRLLASGVGHEVRTTVDGRMPDRDGLLRMADELAALGVGTWILQEGRTTAGAGPSAGSSLLDDGRLMAALARSFETFALRRN